MMLLSTGLHAMDNPSETGIVNLESSDAAEQDIRATEKSKNIIARSFQSLDTWIGENIIKVQMNQQLKSITSVSLPASQNKMRIIEAKINEAFALLDGVTNNGYTTPVKDAVMRAVRTFSQESNIDNKVLKGIVDSAKIALLAPIKLAVKIGAVSIGAGTVAAGNTVAALGAGINRTANRISKANSEVLNSKNNIVLKAVKVFVYTTCISLDGILATADLMAFSAAEGVVIGGVAGYGASTKRVGKVVGLDKNPAIDKRRKVVGLDKNPAIDKRRAEQAAAKEEKFLNDLEDEELKTLYKDLKDRKASRVAKGWISQAEMDDALSDLQKTLIDTDQSTIETPPAPQRKSSSFSWGAAKPTPGENDNDTDSERGSDESDVVDETTTKKSPVAAKSKSWLPSWLSSSKRAAIPELNGDDNNQFSIDDIYVDGSTSDNAILPARNPMNRSSSVRSSNGLSLVQTNQSSDSSDNILIGSNDSTYNGSAVSSKSQPLLRGGSQKGLQVKQVSAINSANPVGSVVRR